MKTHHLLLSHLLVVVLFFLIHQTGWGQQVIVLRPGPLDGQDCEVRTDFPNSPLGYSNSFCADAWTVQGDFVIIRSLIRFDLSTIPSDAIILSAKLSLFCNPSSSHYQLQSGDNESFLMRVLEHWDQDVVTWNTQPATSMNQVIYLPTSTSTTQNYPEIDVTSHVQEMIVNPDENYGWMLKLLTEELYRSMEFSSSNDPDTSYRPMLQVVIQCTPPEVLFSYQVQSPTVFFTDLSSSALSWAWDFGDGYQSSLQHPTHTYQQTGNYLVCLTVTDSCSSATICDTVHVCDQMNPNFEFSQEGHFVIFTDLSTGPESCYWDFGDLFYSSEKDPIHYYQEFGTYYVCLATTNACGSEEYCDSVTITPNSIPELPGNTFNLFPNPVATILTVEVPAITGKDHLSLFNAYGVMLLEKRISDPVIKIDMSPFPSGIYFIRVWNDKNSGIGKFIKYQVVPW
ncbi:DNRLRE domain-containing protein [Bacteroidota bacterium]